MGHNASCTPAHGPIYYIPIGSGKTNSWVPLLSQIFGVLLLGLSLGAHLYAYFWDPVFGTLVLCLFFGSLFLCLFLGACFRAYYWKLIFGHIFGSLFLFLLLGTYFGEPLFGSLFLSLFSKAYFQSPAAQLRASELLRRSCRCQQPLDLQVEGSLQGSWRDRIRGESLECVITSSSIETETEC